MPSAVCGVARGIVEGNMSQITAECAKEMWSVFHRHNLTYEQCINVMVATTKMIGSKANKDEVGAFVMFLNQAVKICPDLVKFTES